MKFYRSFERCRQRNRRSLLTVILVFILVAAISMVYLSYEVVRIPLRKDFFGKDKVSILEERLLKLERDLKKNRQYLNQLTSNIHPNDKKASSKSVALDVRFTQEKFRTATGANVSNELVLTCPLDATSQTASTDITIPDLYSEMSFENEDGGVWKQGWSITYEESQWSQDNKLHVVVVPHSHNDPGWIKTFENYYLDQTRYILNNVVTKLKENLKMKMIWAEISYLALWWEQSSVTERQEMANLIRNGQLEIVTGGWVMNDEAVTHYFAMIQQMIEGHEWLENHIGDHPENGWAIDPFGLSPTMAYLLKRMGLSHMVIQRVHYSVKKHFAKLKTLEFHWRQAWDQANVTDIFCHMMPFYSYDIPHSCGPDPKICCQFDFKRLPGGKINCPWKIAPQPITPANVEEKAGLLLDQYRKKAQLYRSNVLLVPLGDDFRYDKALEWDQQYLNYQALFEFMNSKTQWNVKAQFGTLRDYFSAVDESPIKETKHTKVEIPSLSGDFFTYADREDHYWSGYFSSRPLYKNLDRILESYLRAAEIIFSSALAHLSRRQLEQKYPVDPLLQQLVSARRNLGLFQHHDAITGTGKDPVVIDYGKRLLQSITNVQNIIGKAAALLLSPAGRELESSSVVFDLDDSRASHSSISKKTVIDVTADGRFVAFYNSLGRRRTQIISLLVNTPKLCVLNSQTSEIIAQINPVWHGVEIIDDKFELNFVVDVPALGLSTYVLKASSTESCVKRSHTTLYNVPSLPTSNSWELDNGESAEFVLKSQQLEVAFSADGFLKSVTSIYDNHTESISVSFLTYGTSHKKDKSGAYLFLPDNEATPLEYDPPYFRVMKGQLVSEVRTFLPMVEHSVQLRNAPGVEGMGLHVSNLVDITKELNKELVMRIKTGISNYKTFFTDLNGFQMARRVYLDKLPLQGNFYPISSAIYIEDKTSRFTVLTGQGLGCASLQPGWTEIILDRRLNQDDNRGLQQPVLDNKVTPSSFIFLMERRRVVDATDTQPVPPGLLSLSAHTLLSQFLLYPVIRLIDITEGQPNIKYFIPKFSFLESEFPCDIHVVNLRTATLETFEQSVSTVTLKNYSLLLLHHIGFDCNIYAPQTECFLSNDKINLESLLGKNFQNDVTEVTLTGLYEFEKFPKSKTLLIPPMEINAYKLYR